MEIREIYKGNWYICFEYAVLSVETKEDVLSDPDLVVTIPNSNLGFSPQIM